MQVVHLPFRKNLFSRKRASGQTKFPAIAICCRRSCAIFFGAFTKVAVHGLVYRLLCAPPAVHVRTREAPESLAACLHRK